VKRSDGCKRLEKGGLEKQGAELDLIESRVWEEGGFETVGMEFESDDLIRLINSPVKACGAGEMSEQGGAAGRNEEGSRTVENCRWLMLCADSRRSK
jgi:hypothetical protein